MELVRELRRSPELLANLTRREVKGKYKRTALGQLWSLANPIAAMLIYSAVFGIILQVPVPEGDPSGLHSFPVFLLCGLLPWSFFIGVVNGGMGALVGNENLIKKVWFPRSVLIVATTLSTMFTWSIEMLVLAVVLVVLGAQVWVYLPLVVLVMALLALFATGVAMVFAIANVYFRDVTHLSSILFQAWFYLTPVLYPVSIVAEQSDRIGPLPGGITVLDVYRLNPMERFMEVFRNLLYDNRLPDLGSVLYCVGWTAVALVVGAWVFQRHQGKLAELL
ncbi:ABC transporter [Cellulomonas carbonis T26]|uniref:Transport permease protein n=1 Tax=Cellulomonas carbonis T26 TaxID=947969 RepID=A0A0A0BMQ2_9CELL|nr:ABC transporter [Cellulomonas carbonis T26]